jgi:hypothetical protein
LANGDDTTDLSAGAGHIPPKPPSDGQEILIREKWDQSQLDEATTRRAQRGWVFCTTYAVTILLYFTFGAYVWKSMLGKITVDHMLVWLLAALPVGLTILLSRLSAEPRPQEDSRPAWPEGLVGVASELVGVAKDYVSKLTPK